MFCWAKFPCTHSQRDFHSYTAKFELLEITAMSSNIPTNTEIEPRIYFLERRTELSLRELNRYQKNRQLARRTLSKILNPRSNGGKLPRTFKTEQWQISKQNRRTFLNSIAHPFILISPPGVGPIRAFIQRSCRTLLCSTYSSLCSILYFLARTHSFRSTFAQSSVISFLQAYTVFSA